MLNSLRSKDLSCCSARRSFSALGLFPDWLKHLWRDSAEKNVLIRLYADLNVTPGEDRRLKKLKSTQRLLQSLHTTQLILTERKQNKEKLFQHSMLSQINGRLEAAHTQNVLYTYSSSSSAVYWRAHALWFTSCMYLILK